MLKKSRFTEFLSSENVHYSFGGSSGGGDQDITTTVVPWDKAKPYYEKLYIEAETAFLATSREPYDGQYLAAGNTYDLLAREAIDLATTNMADDIVKIRDHAIRLLSGEFVEENPHVVATIEAAKDSVRRSLTDEILPQLLDASIQGGAYGGTAFSDLALRALADFDREALNITATINYENYHRERILQEGAPNLLIAAEGMEAKKAQLIQANADMFRALRQIVLDEELRHFEDELLAPWRGIQEWSTVLTNGQFTTQTQEMPEDSAIGNVLQGVFGGSAAGFAVGSSIGAIGGPMGAVVGGLLGGVAGLFE